MQSLRRSIVVIDSHEQIEHLAALRFHSVTRQPKAHEPWEGRPLSRYGIDPLDGAVYDAAHDYQDPKTNERGVAPLARRLNMNAGTLQNKVNPNCDTHFPTWREVAALMLVSGDYRPLYAMAAACHHAVYPLLDMASVNDEQLLHAVLKLSREGGDVSAAIDQALRDGRITAAEYVRISGEMDEMLRAAVELNDRLRAHVVDPEHLPPSMRWGG